MLRRMLASRLKDKQPSERRAVGRQFAFQLWMLRGRDGASVKPLRAPATPSARASDQGAATADRRRLDPRLANSRVPNIHLKW